MRVLKFKSRVRESEAALARSATETNKHFCYRSQDGYCKICGLRVNEETRIQVKEYLRERKIAA